MMTSDDLATLRRIAEAATPGPWSACKDGGCACSMVMAPDFPVCSVTRGEWGDEWPAIRVGEAGEAEAYMEMSCYGCVSNEVAIANARFIVAARNHLPALLARLERAEAALHHLAGTANECTWHKSTRHIAADIQDTIRGYFSEDRPHG